MTKSFSKIKKIGEKHGEIEFEAEIPVEIIEAHIEGALAEVAADFQLPGFRKGNVPLGIVREHVSKLDLLESAADAALRTAIEEIIADENLKTLGAPHITITKIAPGDPVAFRIRFAIFPDITLPDYKKIGRTIADRSDSEETSDAEVQGALERLRNITAPRTAQSASAPLPEINDAFAKKLGAFNNLDELPADVKKQLSLEKQFAAKDAKRNEMIREIVRQTKLIIPELLIDQELRDFVEERDAELKKAGLTLEGYLEETKKTADALEKEDRKIIEERLKMGLVVGEIRKKENIGADETEVRANMQRLRPRQGNRTEASLRRTAEAIIIQEKIFDVLEGVAQK